MNTSETSTPTYRKVGQDMWKFILAELKPKGKLLTPFNIISAPIIILGLVLIVLRFATGLGATTNLNQEFPWGIWIGFDVVTGVAFAAGAYIVTFMVYVLRMEKYHSIVRATVLNGFLAYIFYAGALALDLGRPWKIINPIIGNSFGVSSVLFLVAWHFLLYMMAQFIEFSPAIAEWLGLRKLRKILGTLTVGAVVFGICLSMLHQSGLGALFLLAPAKIHPLWYTEYIPVLFIVSSVFAGMSIVIIEGTISHRVFGHQISAEHHAKHMDIMVGLSRLAAAALFVYFFMKVLVLIHGMHWHELLTPMGYLYLFEVLGFVVLPFVIFVMGAKNRDRKLLLSGAVISALGIIINRLNISVIAFKWYAPVHYVPSWIEVVVTLAVVLGEIWAFRWVANRMPVFAESPRWVKNLDSEAGQSVPAGVVPVKAEK
ncbi:MAG: NrfD/PsrC family molybdoenzyme membrane anchor subunit [Desulfobulbales bacterium]|nr:NrfD/PsrC family molybdoenzyme membrane anchor subunit [Desulfobulbales bacterium]